MKDIIIDTTDLESMQALMKEHGGSETAFFGTNADGDTQLISIFYNRIVFVTYRDDGSERRDIFYDDGTSETVNIPMRI